MKPSILLVCLVLGIAVIFATSVKAYDLLGPRWPSATTTFNVDIPGADGLWNTAFENAMGRWNAATTFNFRINHTYEDPCDTGDGVNGVAFTNDFCDDAFPSSALAITKTWSKHPRSWKWWTWSWSTSSRGTTIETDIHFNTARSWIVDDGSFGAGEHAIYDFKRVAVHELGHALGLDHEEDVPSIMYPTVNHIVSPTSDDIAGVRALYGRYMRPTTAAVARDRAALEALYNATVVQNLWTHNTNWKTARLLGEWYGVTTGGGGRVTRLSLGENGLTGPLPAELGSLSDLTSLILWGNTLTGPIPAELGSLSNLTVLDLWGSAVTGPIPAELGSLSNLSVLSLGVNELTGPIPAELGSLSNLTRLILWGNELTGPLPVELTSLRQLHTLDISGNAGLCAPADTAFQAWVATIDDFRGDTCATETEDGVVTNRPALVALYEATDGANWTTQTNWLSDLPISWWYGVTTGAGGRVTRLSLENNDLTGPIPAELGNLSNLEWLSLHGNALTGPIPAALGNLSNLLVLGLGVNDLTGPIPAALGNLSNLTWLNLSGNALTGPIPAELGSLSNLNGLILWGNELTGRLPSELTNLRQLKTLRIEDNDGLCAAADAAFQAWLATIDDFRGGICATEDGVVTNRAALVALYEATDGANWTTQTNWLSNLPISSWYGVTTGAGGRVTRLSLGENGLTGPLPAELGSLSDLTSLILWGNTLTGPIPAELGSLSNLSVLDLWGSAVTGPIPAELGSLSNLSVLSLGVNELTGPVPAELGSLSNLTSLILWGNELTGPLPVELTSLRQLDTLDISGNAGLCAPADTAFQAWLATIDDFRGDTCATEDGVVTNRAALVALHEATDGANWTTQTNWLSNLPISSWYGVTTGAGGRVTRLSLGENGLTGPLPAELGSLSNLTSLILWGNTLTGPIPAELGSLSNLTVLDLWGSAVTGPIPAELGSLSNLSVLSLGVNELTGPVPAELGSLSNLTSLILWGNELTGPLPVELTSLRQLDTLDISGNAGLCAPADTAFQAWLATIDDFRGDTCATEDGVATDRAALVALHEATDGANWTTQTNWLSNLPISSWYGVTTGAGGRVTRLSLGENGLTGPLPAELGSLSDLTSLILWVNALTGPIPDALGNLSNLEVLFLDGNALTGPIPAALGNLSNLEVLFLDGNELTGPIPAALGNLSNLEVLDLSGNELTGPIPEVLGSLSNLEVLGLGGNELTGPIPEVLGSLSNLEVLDLGGNELTGPIPAALGNLSNLEVLDLSGNELTGPIPEVLGSLSNLEVLDLGGNELTGPIPAALGNLSNLEVLDLSGNELTGPIPEVLGSLSNLEVLGLGGNELTGPIPEVLGSLSNLEVLGLGGNELTGPIPEVLGSLSNLEVLDLSGNELTGPIPASLGRLSNLTTLLLDGNALTGPIPDALGNLSSLTRLDLSDNELAGPIPEALTGLSQLVFLHIQDTGLCVPADSTSQEWLATIEDFMGSTCAGSFSFPNRGGSSITSSGTEEATRSGYGRIRAEAGSTTPSGIAIFGFRQGGVLIAEAGVPATEPVQEGRIFAEVRGPVNTGLAIANPNDAPATIVFHFTDDQGERFGDGQFELGAHEQIAKFLDQEPFNSGDEVSGTFTFTSSQPIAVIALRGLTNRDNEFLMTTLPVAPLVPPPTPFSTNTGSAGTVYFPLFADGRGWATQVILVNPTDDTIAGTVRFLGPGSGAAAASPAVLTLDDDRTGSSFDYSIPPRGSQRFTTSNPSDAYSSGSVRATPGAGSIAPSGLVVFSFTPGGRRFPKPACPPCRPDRHFVFMSNRPERPNRLAPYEPDWRLPTRRARPIR